MDDVVDIAVVGGGINGCGIARDAAGRGLGVHLVERGDIGAATSSASTKLLHGGLRYLEHYEFRLVREALEERERLWGIAPHIVRPLRFVLPHVTGMRPRWMLRTGLFLYDHIGGREVLPGTRSLDLSRDPIGAPLREDIRTGWEYSDCWVEDNRLVVLNARDAVRHGATIRPWTACTAARVEDGVWVLTTEERDGGRRSTVRARVLVNAAGPWAGDVAARVAGRPAAGKVRMVQGSHLVTRKLYDHDRCFIFQNPDGRIIFTIPYERDFTLVGTTDRDYDGDLGAVRISEGETDYLLKAASAYFRVPVGRGDVVWSYSGVRPLYDDGKGAAQKATRDYVLETDDGAGAPMLSIFGGKITTYRRLAEAAMEKIAAMLPAATAGALRAKAGWTGRAALPGGDFPKEEFGRRVTALKSAYPFLAADQAERLTRAYGTEAPRVLGDARKAADLGRAFGAGLTEAEVEWMRREEWARDAETILWRRSKLGLRLGREQIEDLGRRMGEIGRAA